MATLINLEREDFKNCPERRKNIPVKSFRLSQQQVEMYEDILTRLGIEGETESDKFRSLIEFLYDYVEVGPPPPEPRVEGDSKDHSRLDVLDLVIQSLRDHEANLDRIATRLEKAAPPSIQAVNRTQSVQ